MIAGVQSDDQAIAHVKVRDLYKTFALAELGSGPVSLLEALRAGRRETVQREVRALRGLSFDIHEGERVGIIGRNGAGKTTLLSLLAGITTPTAGTIETSGEVHAMLTVGAVLREDLTGRENIYLDGAVHGKSGNNIDSHVEEVIAFADLGEFIDRPVRTYSTGMKGRLAFSMGAFVNPDILIVDETLSVGDAFFAEKATRRMKEITAQGRIVILVSHSLGSIDDICDRCLWMEEGRIVMDGPARTVTAAYMKAVEQADESELAAKFEAEGGIVRRGDVGRLDNLTVLQRGEEIAATARALVPLDFSASGVVSGSTRAADLALSILRVDGRRLLYRRMSEAGKSLPSSGAFSVNVKLDPLSLGAGLYRLEMSLFDENGHIDTIHRVIEIIDEQGQFGGVPLLYYPPVITSSPIGEPS